MAKDITGGYNGQILRVNLSNGSTIVEELDPLFCRRYVGGAGFVTYYLWKELPANVDALGPDNKMVFALGPVSGLQLPGAARHCIGAKSPLTGAIIKSEAGGFWAAEFKRAGYDALIIEGRADKPVYLFIQDGEVSIRDADHLWGKETKETQDAIRAELGDDRIAACLIGPAGENMSRFACVMSGLKSAAGRGGLGAVMGSKNLKAVAVRGHRLPKVADSEGLKEIRQQMVARKTPLSQYGTGADLQGMVQTGNLPVRNFRDGLFSAENTNAVVLKETIRIGMDGCYACPIRCKKVVEFHEPYYCDPAYGGPEYETLAALGPNCGIDDLKAISKGNERCGANGLDTISTGGTIAFAMECFEKGFLTKEDTGGIELRFGNSDAMIQVIDMLSRREGIGDLMAEGTARMAEKIGHGSKAFAMHAKGLEAGMHEPRLRIQLGFGWLVGPFGADHGFAMADMNTDMGIGALRPLGILQTVPPDDMGPRRVPMLKAAHCRSMFSDALVTCNFAGVDATEVIPVVTGWDMTPTEQLVVGERILTAARLFNIKQGITAADDVLPERFYQPKTDGVLSDKPVNREKMEKAKGYYYTLMGWDANGVPLPEKVEELYIE
ncbi:MAG: aldehyde ferredoxin oxidoreductase family protein [Dehalococcoidales bacterium]